MTTFRLCLMKFGLGRWTDIVASGALPGKTVGQLNNQMQRMIGQQSTKEFQGLHVDPQKVFAVNKEKDGLARKNGCIINTGENPTREKVKVKREENIARFGLSQEDIDALVIPLPKALVALTDDARREKFKRLAGLQADLVIALRDEMTGGSARKAKPRKPRKRAVDDYGESEDEDPVFDSDDESELEYVPVKRGRAPPTTDEARNKGGFF